MRVRTTLLAALLLTASPALAGKGGTDVLHLTSRTVLVATDAAPDATGSLDLKLRQQGKADVQKLQLQVSGLLANTDYYLFVRLRDAADFSATPELMVTTDENGEAKVKLMHLGHKDKPGKKFPGTHLDPLSQVAAMELRDSDVDGVVVLEADLTDPAGFDRLSYLVKRRLTNEGVDADAEGMLFLKDRGTTSSARLKVANLDLVPGADYTLAIDCNDVTVLDCDYVETVTADPDGRLDLKEFPGTPPAPFQMTDLSLVDGNGAVVLDTVLP